MAAVNVAKVRALAVQHRRESAYIGVALAVFVASIAGGVSARNRMPAIEIQRNRLRSIAHDITTFHAAFRQASLEERAFRFPDSLAVAVSRDARFSVAQRVTQRAEQLGLTDVRVRFAPPDSMDPAAEPPTAPELSSMHIAVADYTLAVDCRGDFSTLLSLVDNLPASVALQRLDGDRAPVGGAVDYHLTLAVFESGADTTHVPAATADVQQVAQLLPYAGAPGDSDLVVASGGVVSPTPDPFAHRAIARIAAVAPAKPNAANAQSKIPAPVYHVTTTLMAGARRAALINDQLIYVGESLPDGSKLTAVERDRVIVTDHSGVAHSVAVAKEGDT